MTQNDLDELEEILGRLLAVLVLRGSIAMVDKDFICGMITPEEFQKSLEKELGGEE